MTPPLLQRHTSLKVNKISMYVIKCWRHHTYLITKLWKSLHGKNTFTLNWRRLMSITPVCITCLSSGFSNGILAAECLYLWDFPAWQTPLGHYVPDVTNSTQLNSIINSEADNIPTLTRPTIEQRQGMSEGCHVMVLMKMKATFNPI